MRVLRLLLAGTPPERILAPHLHQGRRGGDVEARLRHAGRVGDEPTRQSSQRKLADCSIGPQPTPAEIQRARTLFATAIETPGGLKVQTIHAFCERLLQRFPLEAGVAPGFTILDEHDAPTRCNARRSTRCWREATDATRRPCGQALAAGDRLRRRRALRRAAARRASPEPRLEAGSAPRQRRCGRLGCAHWRSRCGKR